MAVLFCLYERVEVLSPPKSVLASVRPTTCSRKLFWDMDATISRSELVMAPLV